MPEAPKRRGRPPLHPLTEKAIYNAWHGENEWRDRKRPDAEDLLGKLRTANHVVSLRSIQRRYSEYADAEGRGGAERWRITDARSPEELELLLPLLAGLVGSGREVSKDQAAIFLTIRRALPKLRGFAWYLARHYDEARRGDASGYTAWKPWTVDEIEDFIALAYVDQTHPGVLEKAIEAGEVRKITEWWNRIGEKLGTPPGHRLAEPRIHACGRKFWTNENYERHEKDCDGTSVVEQVETQKRKAGTGSGKKSTR